ncbi:MAG TPA: sigma-54 dependent transcriptional regulator [Syntrophales bacterium]|nr:sigma-54 dependent transcriptional regulator [Syntrophales bacterium]
MKKTPKRSPRVLIIDDEDTIRDGCSQTLTRSGCTVETSGDALEGLRLASRDVYDVVLLDIRMPKVEGLELLRRLKQESGIRGRIIVITGYGTIPLSVEAMRLGAFNFLTKPFDGAALRRAVEEAAGPGGDQESGQPLAMLIGGSDYMQELRETLRKIAQTDSTVLITGESGTGKELVARTLHSLSRRSSRPFVAVDCSSLVENLMESELFGHLKGAFSGATERREGRFQMAHEGSIFLDEIGNLSLQVQTKLLRALQEREVPRVGSSTPEKVDVRVITATNRDIRAEVDAGRFREDLFYRISVIPVEIRPLREHRADILPIAQHYLEIFRIRHASTVRQLSEEVKKSLLAYNWPGNIRELKNTIERLCVLCDHETVQPADILYYGQSRDSRAPVVDAFSGRMTLVDVEKEHIEKALRHFHGQINKTAQFLGIDRKTLRLRIRSYGIRTDEDER